MVQFMVRTGVAYANTTKGKVYDIAGTVVLDNEVCVVFVNDEDQFDAISIMNIFPWRVEGD